MSQKLIFVYNAKSDIINSAFDFAHKLISPKTYNCQLCKLTHGSIGEKKAWKEFRDTSNLEMVFFHKDEFEEKFHHKFQYPIILSVQKEEISTLIESEKLKPLNSVEDLIKKLQNLTLATYN